MQGIQTVLFDLDGTLVDSLSLIQDTYQAVFRHMGLPWGDGEVMRFIGISLREIAARFAPSRADEFIRFYQREYERGHDARLRTFPGSRSILESLGRRGYQTGVVTSKGRHGACLALRLLQLEELFDIMVTADDVHRTKPHPEPVVKALRALGTPPWGAVFVGDSPFDFEAGRRAGVRTLAVSWGLTPLQDLNSFGVDGVLLQWADLDSYLRRSA
ncbi:MAG: HAD-IA family hydrolase [Thermoanaerobacterales bacterium]|nr:HAD-IA family hydrolase [Bacillota bacterium]MDI6907180.1 HAD-IA family hydrolase [Thermoanaerobacterales bacterium]